MMSSGGTRLVVAILVAMVVAGRAERPARAQPAPVHLTLDEAVARGLEASHRLAEARARESAATAAVAAARATFRPQVTALAGYTRTNHVPELGIPQPGGAVRVIFPDIPDNYRARLDVAWPLYTGGRNDALARATALEADAASDDLEAARADLRLDITRAYWALATATETVRVAEEGLRRVDAHLADVKSRQAVGLVPPSDVLSVEARRARQQGLLVEARNGARRAAAELARLVGLPPETPIELDLVLTPAALPPAPVAALAEAARAARPERRALAARVDAANARMAAVQAGGRPQVSVVGGVDYANPNPRILPRVSAWKSSWEAGVSVAWPVWDGGRLDAQAAEAAAGVQAARERLLEFDSRLELEIRERWLDIESSLAALEAAEAAVRAAAEARRVVTERYRQGVATATDVLDAQAALVEAELERTRVLAASRIAEAALRRALGQ
jgi:outer membrane protein